jgi:hypothetical protein
MLRVTLLVITILLAAAGAALPACASQGHSSPALEGDDGGTEAGAPAAPSAIGVAIFSAPCNGTAPAVDWSPVRRISRVEYDNMVRDLLGDTTQPAEGFVPESPMANGVNFETNTYTEVSTLIAQQYQQAAETLAQTAVSNAATLSTLLSCQTQDDACAQQFIASFAGRAYRGQLDADESAALLQIHKTVSAQFDFATGIQAVITAVLVSPRFLYVLEFGDGSAANGVEPLSPNEVAGRLSLFLWRSVPDTTLMQAAAAGQLATPGQVEAQATRMLSDPRATGAIEDFTTQWLQLQGTAALGKDTQFAAWNANPKLGEEMKDETLANFSQGVLAENVTLSALLTSTDSYINQDLATFYGVALGTGAGVAVNDPALPTGSTFVKTTIPNRAGILTNGSVLATQAHTTLPSSVLRGKLVREDVLCDVLHPPPPGVPPAPTSVPEGGTTRSQFEAHETIPGCVTCHQYMDPIGFGFGHFDATGAYQATDANGMQGTFPPIDATGQINAMNPGELSASFDGAIDLASKLSGATQVQQCFTLQQFRYALGRLETYDDACSLQQIYGAASSASMNVQKLLIALVRSDAFLKRSAGPAGGACQ